MNSITRRAALPLRRPSRTAVGLGLMLGVVLLSGTILPWGTSLPSAAAQSAEVPCTGTMRPVSLPLTDLGPAPYVRMDGTVTEFTGGLYPGGSNTRPPEMEAAGQAIAAQIVPLDPSGAPDPVDGRIVLISLGMSNTQIEFQRFLDDAHRDPRVNPFLTMVSGALGGQTADRWVDPEAQPWLELEARLRHAGVTPLQVEIAWIKQTLTRTGDFPGKALELQAALETIVQNLHSRFPNLRLVFLSSRTRSYMYDRGLSPEPAAFETGFAVKWLIEAQLNGDPDLNYDPERGPVRAPFLVWGPYLWIDGTNPRSDGMTWQPEDLAQDCTHPSPSGADKVAQMLMTFFTSDTLAAPWFLPPALQPSPVPASPTVPSTTATPLPPTTAPRNTPTLPAATGPTEQGDAAQAEAANDRTGIPLDAVAALVVVGTGAAVFLLRRKR